MHGKPEGADVGSESTLAGTEAALAGTEPGLADAEAAGLAPDGNGDTGDGASGRPSVSPGGLLLVLVAVALGLAGGRLAGAGGREALTTGVLLLVAALAAAAVGVGARPYGPGRERQPDLSVRIGLGVLGGLLAGLLHGVLSGAADAAGLLAAAGATGISSTGFWGVRLLHGAAWGLLLGLAWRFLPGRDFVRRGALFGLLPSFYLLLLRFPLFGDAGLLGLRLGIVAVLLLVVANLVAGVVAAAVVAWGARPAEGPLSRAIVS
ncbi:MAG: hypothetical protein RRA92_02195 [Gemmatimonadota bacterium]|nr:hypothetical protein [Gemmatimonadota bacterium]